MRWTMSSISIAVLLGLAITSLAFAQSTSPDVLMCVAEQSPLDAPDAFSIPITFSEYPIGTHISSQYSNRGIIFGGSSPFISPDGANPTSPVLSGTPRFMGPIEGRFVDPDDGVTPVVVARFRFDAGYFDSFGSTRVSWFDPEGKKLGQRTNSRFAIENFEIKGGNIGSWRIEIIANEPAGYGIDNVAFEPLGPSVLFRELSSDAKDGSWGRKEDEIPGWDHSAFQIDNLVFESHPGYAAGTYVSADGDETAQITQVDGVQAQFTRDTFAHESTAAGSTSVVDFEEIPIDRDLAERMRTYAQSQAGALFGRIDFRSLSGIQQTLAPSVQKGANGTFTCVGLVEAAAEHAGLHLGTGFVPGVFEEVTVPIAPPLPLTITIPTLSPQLLNYAMKAELTLDAVLHYLQGVFDPAEVIVIDPLGRRLGYSAVTGEHLEIPRAFFSGFGKYQQFLIPRPIPGTYRIEVTGLGAAVNGVIASDVNGQALLTELQVGEQRILSQFVPRYAGAPGDVNGDGSLDQPDRNALVQQIPRYTDRADDAADLNGDGEINATDLELLDRLLDQAVEPTITCFSSSARNTPGLCVADVECGLLATCSDSSGVPLSVSCSPSNAFPVGSTEVSVTCSSAEATVTRDCTAVVSDVEAPRGKIVGAQRCSAATVTLSEDFTDNCSTPLRRSWSPGPGPFAEQGDYSVSLTATDASGNIGMDTVEFTIDRVSPELDLYSVPRGWLLPSMVPFTSLFMSSDDDDAEGGVVHEMVSVNGCVIYDGSTFGDHDGLLLDEVLPASEVEACRLVSVCGVREWSNPTISVTASDCAGNSGTKSSVIRGDYRVLSKQCE